VAAVPWNKWSRQSEGRQKRRAHDSYHASLISEAQIPIAHTRYAYNAELISPCMHACAYLGAHEYVVITCGTFNALLTQTNALSHSWLMQMHMYMYMQTNRLANTSSFTRLRVHDCNSAHTCFHQGI
jgi:hypothetical protein